MSQKMPTKTFHSVPVLGEDLALDFRAGPTRDIVFIDVLTIAFMDDEFRNNYNN